MPGITQLISLVGIVVTAVITLVTLVTFRKERPIPRFSPLWSAVLSLLLLPLFMLLSGARLNALVAVPILLVGLVIGLLRGLATRLHYKDGKVVGKNSMLFLLGWGSSLVLAQLLNLLGSALATSLGLIPLFLSTGTEVGMNGSVFLRRVKMRVSSQ